MSSTGDSSSTISEAFKSQRHHSSSSHHHNHHNGHSSSSVVEEKVLLNKLISATKALTGRTFSFSTSHLDAIVAGEEEASKQIISVTKMLIKPNCRTWSYY